MPECLLLVFAMLLFIYLSQNSLHDTDRCLSTLPFKSNLPLFTALPVFMFLHIPVPTQMCPYQTLLWVNEIQTPKIKTCCFPVLQYTTRCTMQHQYSAIQLSLYKHSTVGKTEPKDFLKMVFYDRKTNEGKKLSCKANSSQLAFSPIGHIYLFPV